MSNEHGRSRPAHPPPVEQGKRSIILFVTVCTKERRPRLANAITHEFLKHAWQRASFWRVGFYLIMPDHLHFFCSPNRHPPTPLRPWMAFWKNEVSRNHPGPVLWQRDFWDTQLRRTENYGQKWHYVRENPVRKGWVKQPEDWPYQGELNPLDWHDS